MLALAAPASHDHSTHMTTAHQVGGAYAAPEQPCYDPRRWRAQNNKLDTSFSGVKTKFVSHLFRSFLATRVVSVLDSAPQVSNSAMQADARYASVANTQPCIPAYEAISRLSCKSDTMHFRALMLSRPA